MGTDDLQRRISNSLLIVIACTALGGVLYFVPHLDEGLLYGAGLAFLTVMAAFLVGMRNRLPLVLAGIFVALGALLSFVTGLLSAPLVGLLCGLVIASVHTLAHVLHDFRAHTSIGARPSVARNITQAEVLPAPFDLERRQDRALEYVFGYTGKKLPTGKMDTFKRRITRDNIKTQGLLSQKEWRGWVGELEAARIIEAVNAQVTKPLVPTYEAAKKLLDEYRDGFVFETDSTPEHPKRLVRKTL